MKIANRITLTFLAASLVLVLVIAPIIYMIEWRSIFFLFLIIIPLLGWLFAAYASRMISEPILRLARGVRIIGGGNLYHKVGTDSRDEIGELSRAFDRMTERLRESTTFIEELNREKARSEKANRDLREREDHFRRLFEQSNDAVFIYDMEGRMLDVNTKACDMLGYGKEELLNIPFLELHTEEELSKSKEAFRTGKETFSIRFQSRFRKKGGEEIDVEISSSVIDLKKGVMQGIVRDITGQKSLESALRESEERFRTFMETASDLMYITDREDVFTYVNQAMAGGLGYGKEELLGMRVPDITDPSDAAGRQYRHTELVEKGEVFCQPCWLTKQGKSLYGEMKVTAIYDDSGGYAGSRGVFRDVTERKKLEMAQRLAQLGKLVSDMAHEVNNPLQIISGRAQLSMMTGRVDEKTKGALETIVDQCEWARDIIQRLLMFSRPSKGLVEDVDLNESVEFVSSLVEHQLSLNNIKILRDLDRSIPPVSIDKKQLQEVLMNLIRNASEAMPSGGEITISTGRDNGGVRVEVRDNGEGISEEDMKKIFDPFFTTKEKGTGLGLSVCYGIIKAHGGILSFDSKSGEGTTASMIFPPSERRA